jgi:hypothetical protein
LDELSRFGEPFGKEGVRVDFKKTALSISMKGVSFIVHDMEILELPFG